MFQNDRPRHGAHWRDRWRLFALLTLLLLIAVALSVACRNPARATTLNPAPNTTIATESAQVLSGVAEPNTVVSLYANDQFIGETVSDVNGNFSFALRRMPPGRYQFKAIADANDVRLESQTVSLDFVAPAPISIVNAPAAQNAKAIATADVSTAQNAIATAIADASAAQNAKVTAIADVSTAQNAKVTAITNASAAQNAKVTAITNASAAQNAKTIPVSTPAPILVAFRIKPTLDLQSPVIAPLVRFAGTAAPNVTVRTYDGVNLIGETKADATGKWRLELLKPLGKGEHSFTIASVKGGTEIARSEATTISVVPPPLQINKPPGQLLLPGTISGTGAPGATITLSANGLVIGATTVDANGAWVFGVPDKVGNGIYLFEANQSNPAASVSVSIDVLWVTMPITGDWQPPQGARFLGFIALGVAIAAFGVLLLRRASFG